MYDLKTVNICDLKLWRMHFFTIIFPSMQKISLKWLLKCHFKCNYWNDRKIHFDIRVYHKWPSCSRTVNTRCRVARRSALTSSTPRPTSPWWWWEWGTFPTARRCTCWPREARRTTSSWPRATKPSARRSQRTSPSTRVLVRLPLIIYLIDWLINP